MNRKIAVDREIPLRGPEPSKRISPQVPLSTRKSRSGVHRRVCEGGWIEPLSAGARRSKNGNTLGTKHIEGPWNYIGSDSRCSQASTDLRTDSNVNNINGRRGSSLNNILQGPAMQNGPCQDVRLGRRNVIGNCCRECVANVKV